MTNELLLTLMALIVILLAIVSLAVRDYAAARYTADIYVDRSCSTGEIPRAALTGRHVVAAPPELREETNHLMGAK